MKKISDCHLDATIAASRPRRRRPHHLGGMLLLAALVIFTMLVFARPAAQAQTTAQTSKSDSAAAGNAQNGKKLFTSYGCYECHGHAAQGGTGPRLGPSPLPLSAFVAYVRHPAASMPPYTAKVASDQDLADIHAFLASLPASPKAKDIPLLNQ